MQMKFVHVLLFVASVTMALSGCVGGKAAAKDVTPAAGGAPAFDDSTGSIHGTVRTEELAPIPGAQVGVLGGNNTIAGEDGSFSLNFLQPGKATVSVVALGYQSTSKVVEVAAGTVVNADFVLSILPTVGPYYTINTFKNLVGAYTIKATPTCMYVQSPTGGGGSSTKTCQGGNLVCTPGPCEVNLGHCGESGSAFAKYGCDFTNEWQSIIGEVMWTPQTSVTGRGWLFEILAPNVTRSSGDTGSVDQSDKHDWLTITDKAPIQTRIDDDTFMNGSPSGSTHPMAEGDRCGGIKVTAPHCGWGWRLFGAWCTIHGVTGGVAGCNDTGPDFCFDPTGQPVTTYFTYFIREKAPAGFTAVPDA